MAGTAVKISFLADAGPARKGLDDIAQAAEKAGDRAESALKDVGRAADTIDTSKAKRSIDDLSDSTDDAATRTGTFASALGAFSGGLEAVGLEKYATGLAGAAVGVDVFSNASDVATLALESKYIASVKDKLATLAAIGPTGALAAANRVLNATLRANPVLAVVGVLVALIGILAVVYAKSEAFRNIVNGVGTALKTGFLSAIQPLLPALKQLWATIQNQLFPAIRSALQPAVDKLRAAWVQLQPQITAAGAKLVQLGQFIATKVAPVLIRLYGSYLSAVVTGLVKVIGAVVRMVAFTASVVRFFASFGSAVGGAISAIGRVVSAVAAFPGKLAGYFSSAVSVAKSLPGRIVSAVGNLGSLLYNAGAKLISGLASGMTSKLGAIRDKAREIANSIKDFFPGSPVKEGPLKAWNNGGAGSRLVSFLVDGLNQQTAAASKAAGQLAASVVGGFGDPSLSSAVSVGGFGASSNLAGPGVVINVYALQDGADVGRRVVQAIKDYEKFNGSGWRG